MAKDIIDMIDAIKNMLIGDPTIEDRVIFDFCSILEKQSFVLPNFLYRIEYPRVAFDSFGRIKYRDEPKSKYLWLSFFILKLFTVDAVANLYEITGSKQKAPIML